MSPEEIQQAIEKLEARNSRVEADKAWEVSGVRVYSVAVVTYVVAVALLTVIGNDNAWVNALVPVAGYLLSTQSLPMVKRWWIGKFFKK